MPKARLYKPNTVAKEAAPMSGRMNSTMPRAIETIPPSSHSARSPALSQLRNVSPTS